MDRALLRTAAVIAAATVAGFWATLSADFVYDARLQILTDPFLHDPSNWWHVLTFRVLGMDVLDFNRPVHLASMMLDAAVWGTNPFGYHLTSVLLHAVNVVLVWLVLRVVLASGGREAPSPQALVPLIGAALFAFHPVVVEAVCEPTFREDLLAALFTLGAVVLASRHDPRVGVDVRRAVACAGCCLLAVGSKESGVAAPFVLAAFWLVFRRREPRDFWLAAVGAGLAVVTAFLAARFLLEPTPSRIFEIRPEYPGGSFVEAMKVEPRILAFYAQLIVFPANLCADYGGYSVRHLPLWLAGVILVILAGAGAVAAWRDRRVAFGLALTVLPLVPVSNLVPIYRAAADRYLYLPLAGIACVVACLLDAPWLHAREPRRRLATLVAIAAVVGLLAGCLERQQVWRSQLALWTDTYARNPGSFNGASGLAGALRETGRHAEAIEMARRAIALSEGGRGDAWMGLALAFEAAGRPTEADTAADKAVDLDPRLADPDARVAALAMERGEADLAKTILARRAAP
ncbi:MAG: hypothetical protein ACKO6E_03545 [Planctomycetota bacterium]